MNITITGEDKKRIPAEIEIRKREKDQVVYHGKQRVEGEGKVELPEGDDIEAVITAPDHVPKKIIIRNSEKERTVLLDRIREDKPVVIDNILFEIDRAYLKKESIDILDKLVILLKSRRDLTVDVRGHTDSTGDEAHNLKLSERRADAVVEYRSRRISPEQISQGIRRTRASIQRYGEAVQNGARTF
jgi:outer membrane protein OmpA-like peptidoglycan-associated protein